MGGRRRGRGERSRSRRVAGRVGSGAKKREIEPQLWIGRGILLFRQMRVGVGRGGGRGRDEGESRGSGRTCWGFSPFTFSKVAMFRFLSCVYPELPASLRGGYRSGLASSHARAREVFVANLRGLSAPLLSLNPPPWGFRVLRRASVERNLSFASLRCERRRRVSARDSSKV